MSSRRNVAIHRILSGPNFQGASGNRDRRSSGGIDAADVVYAMESEAHVYSLFDQVSFDHESLELHEVLPGDLGVETSVCESIALSDALSALSEIERTVVAMRFFEERTQAETASLLGISQPPQVHRIEKAALLALRRSMEGE